MAKIDVCGMQYLIGLKIADKEVHIITWQPDKMPKLLYEVAAKMEQWLYGIEGHNEGEFTLVDEFVTIPEAEADDFDVREYQRVFVKFESPTDVINFYAWAKESAEWGNYP